MMPMLRRTWAPCGATPTFSVRARSHEKVSGIGALVVSPHRQQITLALALYPRLNIRGPQVLRFLRHLARHVRGPVILVWDRGNPHKHQFVRAWLARHPRWEIVWFSALCARPQPRGAALELPQVRPTRELRSGHRRRDPTARLPRAPAPGPPAVVAEEFLSPLGPAFSCLE